MPGNPTIDKQSVARSEATKLQDSIVGGVIESLDDKQDAFIFGPTGVGKSRMFSLVAANRAEKGQRVIVLSHRQNLVLQGARSMEKWVEQPISTSIGMYGQIDQSGDVVYSTIQTAHELRDHLQPYDAAVIDEAHHVNDENAQYHETIAALIARNPDILLIAASATPPEGYEGLHPRLKAANKHVITFEEAVKAKLVRLPETKRPAMVYKDHSRVADIVTDHRKNSKSAELETGISKALSAIRGEDWAEQEVSQYERFLIGRRTLGYFDSIKEANAFVEEAQSRGHKVAAIHSGQSRVENEQLRADFEAKRIDALVSVDMISEGYDIDCDGILLGKKTTSATEYKQIIGRGSRGHGVDAGRRTILVDLGASTCIHGEIGTLADLQTLRGELERKTLSGDELLPDAAHKGFKPWVEVKVPGSERSVWGTSLDGAIIYTAPTENGYAAFASTKDRKGSRIDLLGIEGQRKGLPTKDALSGWIIDAVQRNERALARLVGQKKDGITELARMIGEDWHRNANSIARSIGMLTASPDIASHRYGQQAALQQVSR